VQFPLYPTLGLQFAADFADIYEVRGLRRMARGHDLEPELTDREASLGYRGLDGIVRRTVLQFTPRPQSLDGDRARFEIALTPKQAALLYVTVGCVREPDRPRLLVFERARAEARAQLDSQVAHFCAIDTVNGQFDALVKRATADLHMMTTVLPTGLYPYAGVPWFNTPSPEMKAKDRSCTRLRALRRPGRRPRCSLCCKRAWA
jgi:glycogen debranching enzyme